MSLIAAVRIWADVRLGMLFPFRQIVFRSNGKVRCLDLTPRLQGVVTSVLLVAGGWVALTSANMMLHEMELVAKDAQIANVRVAYRSLLSDVADYQKRFSGVVRNLEQNQAMMLALANKNSKLKIDVGSLKTARKERAETETARVVMYKRLGDAEKQMQFLAKRNFSLKDDMATIETDLQDALTERNTALMESTQMRRDIKVLKTSWSIWRNRKI
ncbi:MAG: hypothetical protein JKY27_10770 [Magnetovibrio sp.]|nr:hypothetical protein [Magnetovibrio sp.]